ncbi:hypothetical protein ACF0H5_021171 [Mactra antiquata]
MSWYSQMMKSQELARERNRRDARRLESQRHGPQFVAKYRLAALDKEKRIIEKELERIRKGVHRAPKLTDVVNSKGNHVLTIPSPRLTDQRPQFNSINPEYYSKDENKLYDAILFLQHNPSALVPILSAHAQSDAYFETLERITPRLSDEFQTRENKIIKTQLMQEHMTRIEREELINKYSVLLHRHSPELRKSSPLLNRHKNSPVQRKDSPLLQDAAYNSPRQTPPRNINLQDSTDGRNTNQSSIFLTNNEDNRGSSKTPTASNTPRKLRQPLSIGKLADSGMSTARDSVTNRLTGSSEDQQRVTGSHDDNQSTNRHQSEHDKAETATSSEHKTMDRSRPTKAAAMFPSYDPDVYNPDGTKKTYLTLPPLEESLAEAKKARYIRHPKNAENEEDREYTIQEIFQK